MSWVIENGDLVLYTPHGHESYGVSAERLSTPAMRLWWFEHISRKLWVRETDGMVERLAELLIGYEWGRD